MYVTKYFYIRISKNIACKAMLYFIKMDTYTDLQVKKIQFKLIDANNRISQLDNMIGDKIDIPFATYNELLEFTQNATDEDLNKANYTNWNVNPLAQYEELDPYYTPSLFYHNTKVTTLDLSKWNTQNWTNFGALLAGSALTSVNITGMNTSKAKNMTALLSGTKLQTVDISTLDTSNVTDMSDMFNTCRELITITGINTLNTLNVITMYRMFKDCMALTSLDLSGWNVSNVNNFSNMFKGCSSLETIYLSGWLLNESIDVDSMFSGCTALQNIHLENTQFPDDVSNITNTSTMFNNASNTITLYYDGGNGNDIIGPLLVNLGYSKSGETNIPPSITYTKSTS